MTEQLDLLAPPRDTAAILRLVAGDPLHQRDRERIVAAILADADDHDGKVDPNRVRLALTGPYGLTVYPRVLSSMYAALAYRKDAPWWLEWRGDITENHDRAGGNNGKPLRVWTLVEAAEVAA